jgi:hypothetical protein
MVNPTSNTRYFSLNLCASAARGLVGIGRFLLLLTFIFLVTTPLTQHFWTWDRFLHGGQDYESSTLMMLAFLCLVLVLAQHCKQSVDLLLAAQHLFSFLTHDLLLAGIPPVGAVWALWTERVASPGLETQSLPLLI